MDRYSILAKQNPDTAPEPVVTSPEPAVPQGFTKLAGEKVRFPGEDGGRSLADMAQRDLDAALQLLAERAQYITGASGAAIALREAGEMVCRARAGESAPELGAHLQVDSGLSGESVRTKQILRCDDAESDPRVNRESCRALGIASVMVMPLVQDQEVFGVFELFSGRAYAFEERDVVALQRIADMIKTAVDHAAAGKRADQEISAKPEFPAAEKPVVTPVTQAAPVPAWPGQSAPRPVAATPAAPSPVAPVVNPPVAKIEPSIVSPNDETAELKIETVPLVETSKVRKCEACGFPVSEGRKLCLDCEKALPAGSSVAAASSEAPGFMYEYGGVEESWLSAHKNLIIIALAILVLISVLLKMR